MLIVMRLKKLGAALSVVAALGAVLAGGAFAAAVTQDAKWYTGAAPGTALIGSETVTTEQVGTGSLSTVVSGTSIVLHMTGAKCVSCKIENSGTVAVGSGSLEFTGVTVEKPAKCTTGSTVLTKTLSFQADWMKALDTEPNYWKFVPAAGEEASFLSFELAGAECALKNTVVTPAGTVFFQSASATATQAVSQQVSSSATVKEIAGGTLHVGASTALLTSTVNFKLGGERVGVAFGTRGPVATTDVKWYTGAAPGTELTTAAAVKSAQIGTATFVTTVAGQTVELGSTGMNCSGCVIENSGGTAVGSGKLEFTGVTVLKPANCSVTSTITSNALKIKADYMISSADYILFEPSAGVETGFATVELTGASCVIKSAIVPKGTLFVKAQNATGIQAAEQRVNSSAAINSEAGGTLRVGSEAASLTGEAKFELSGGGAFGTH